MISGKHPALQLQAIILSLLLFFALSGILSFYPTHENAMAAMSVKEPTGISSSDSAIQFYKEAMASAERTMNNIHKTAANILTLVTLMIAFVGVVGLGQAWSTSRTSRRAEDALEKARTVLQQISHIQATSEKLEKVHDSLHKEIEVTQGKMKNMSRDVLNLRRSLELIQIEDYELKIYEGDSGQASSAIISLIEMSRRSDAVIRKRCAEVFCLMDRFVPEVRTRLSAMIKDESALVRIRSTAGLRKQEHLMNEYETSLKNDVPLC